MISGQCAWTDEGGRCSRPIAAFREQPGRRRQYPVCHFHMRIIDAQTADKNLRTSSNDVAS